MKKPLSVVPQLLLLLKLGQSQSTFIENSRDMLLNYESPVKELSVQIDVRKIRYLGFGVVDDFQLLGPNKPTNVTAIPDFKLHLDRPLYHYEYNDYFVIQTPHKADLTNINKPSKQHTFLFYTIRALEILQLRYPYLYRNLILDTVLPQMDQLAQDPGLNWVNKFGKIIISFNTGRRDVAISGTYLDQHPIDFSLNGRKVSLYENLAIISINPDLIKGTDKKAGSYPIYRRESAAENFDLYLKEGLLHSICHELFHRYIDIFNNWEKSIYQFLYFGDGRKSNTDATYNEAWYDLEEIMTNKTMHEYFVRTGGLSETLIHYYERVEQHIEQKINRLPEYLEEVKGLEGLGADSRFTFRSN